MRTLAAFPTMNDPGKLFTGVQNEDVSFGELRLYADDFDADEALREMTPGVFAR